MICSGLQIIYNTDEVNNILKWSILDTGDSYPVYLPDIFCQVQSRLHSQMVLQLFLNIITKYIKQKYTAYFQVYINITKKYLDMSLICHLKFFLIMLVAYLK